MTRYKPIIYIILAILVVIAFISYQVITSPNRTSTTPALIQRAFDKGEITAEQRLLYLTYAVYEYKSLPVRFRGKVPWEATSLLFEMNIAMRSPSVFCSMSSFAQSEIRRLVTKVDTICD